MSTLKQILEASDALSPEEVQELLLKLTAKLRASAVPLPTPRTFTREQMNAWVNEDQAEMNAIKESREGGKAA